MRTRPTAVLGIVAVLVVALAVVAAVVSSTRNRADLDPSSPDGVVQLYVTALFEDDVAAAVEYLDPALGCSEQLPEVYLQDSARIAVGPVTQEGGRATVDLRIEEGSVLEGGWSHSETFTLRRDGETWLITGEPWPIWTCEKWEK